MAILSMEEQKQILFGHIAPATGRTRQLLEVLLESYPFPIEKKLLEQKLSMEGKHALGSVVRNAKIFIEIHRSNDAGSKQWYYLLDDSYVRVAKTNRIMNPLAIPR